MTTENDPTPATIASTRVRRAKLPTAGSTANSAPSKSDTVIKLLLRTKGATPLELIAATDWQPHSIRAFLSGLRKNGRSIVREARKNGEFAYRITGGPAVTKAPEAEPIAESSDGATGTMADA